MSWLEYLKARWADALLCTLMAGAMARLVSTAFNVPTSLQDNPLFLFCFAAVVVVYLEIFSRTRRLVVVGTILMVAACAVALGLAAALLDSAMLADTPDSPVVLICIEIVTVVVVYLLARAFAGSLVAFVCGCCALWFVGYGYGSVPLWSVALFFAAVIACVIYRRAVVHSMGTIFEGKPGTASIFGLGVGVALYALAVAALVWFVVLAPLSPGALQAKLFTEHRAYQEQEITGIGDVELKQNDISPEIYVNSNVEYSSAKDDEKQQQQQQQQQQQSQDNEANDSADNSGKGFDQESPDGMFAPISYEIPVFAWVLLPLLLVALIAAVICLKRWSRKRWLLKISDKSPNTQAQLVYLRLVERLRRIGIPKPLEATPEEFARLAKDRLRIFDGAAGDIEFSWLSERYTAACYGDEDVTEEELIRFRNYLRGFYKGAYAYLGKLKYATKFFWL